MTPVRALMTPVRALMTPGRDLTVPGPDLTWPRSDSSRARFNQKVRFILAQLFKECLAFRLNLAQYSTVSRVPLSEGLLGHLAPWAPPVPPCSTRYEAVHGAKQQFYTVLQ